VGVVVGVDGGNSKTDVVVASTDGEPLSFVRGGGSNAHAPDGYRACIDLIDSLVHIDGHAERAVLFLCGADVPSDIETLTALARERDWATDVVVDNDTFALLHAGSDRADAVAVICGSGINCVARSGDRVARWPSLGWETGDWGGAEELGRTALYHANRAADGRGEPTVLVDVIERHFGKSVVEVGSDIHFKRMPHSRMGEIAPAIVAATDDPVALELVHRLADECALLVERAFAVLELEDADVVLGGGMLEGRGRFFDLVAERLPVEPIVPDLPPVAGSVLAALDGAAQQRFREAFRGWSPRG
jgi:N-acetylglucosamine kinase-like BadF-type ATPase